MNIPASQIEEAWSLIESAHPDCVIAVKTDMWKHISYEGATPHYRIGYDVSVFETWKTAAAFGRKPGCEVVCFRDVDALLQWAKDGAKIEEVADSDA
jgi:hypothetical protein